jgi:Na+:H+ antiporter, NhaA family
MIHRALKKFLGTESASGMVLLGAAGLALLIANSPAADDYQQLLKTPVTVPLTAFSLSVGGWIKDALMAVFFLVIGLEIKRELLRGELATLRRAMLPLFGAIGGMLLPALVYVGFTWDNAEALRGWAIPGATDIAFAVGMLALISKHVPPSLKIFLLALAIIDDLGAVIIIALFYSGTINLTALLFAIVIMLGLSQLNDRGVKNLWFYLLPGIGLWLAMHASGVHATVAGVLLASVIPLSGKGINQENSPALKLEHALHPWVAFGIMPIFALANAGVPLLAIDTKMLTDAVTMGTALGLCIGKPVGIFLFAWLAIRFGLASRPASASWLQLWGVCGIAGIGFTMSLFIANLAFSNDLMMDEARLGILIGSFISAILGLVTLLLIKPTHRSN